MSDRSNASGVGRVDEPAEGDGLVRFCGGPSRCMDDLCRNSSMGLCGLTDADCDDDQEDDDDPRCDECGCVAYECHCDYSVLTDGTIR